MVHTLQICNFINLRACNLYGNYLVMQVLEIMAIFFSRFGENKAINIGETINRNLFSNFRANTPIRIVYARNGGVLIVYNLTVLHFYQNKGNNSLPSRSSLITNT